MIAGKFVEDFSFFILIFEVQLILTIEFLI